MTTHGIHGLNQSAGAPYVAQIQAAKVSVAEGLDHVHASALGVGSAGDPRVSSSILKPPASPCEVVPNFATNTTLSARTESSDDRIEYIPYKNNGSPTDTRAFKKPIRRLW
jgi:hypothetical protein